MITENLLRHGTRPPPYALSTGDLDRLSADEAAAWVRGVEELGFGMIWLSEVSGREAFTSAQASLSERYPGRYLLGLGVSGASRERGIGPASFMRAYLEDMDRCEFEFAPASGRLPRVLGAYSPHITRLAASHADGLITFLVTPDHTRWARQTLGAPPFLSVVQWVLPEAEGRRARTVAREALAYYLGLPHQLAKLRRLGFDDRDMTPPGSDRLIDALVAWGGEGEITERLRAHFAAGADQVAIAVVGPPGPRKREQLQAVAQMLALNPGASP